MYDAWTVKLLGWWEVNVGHVILASIICCNVWADNDSTRLPVGWRASNGEPAVVSVAKFAAMFWEFYSLAESSSSPSRSIMSVLDPVVLTGVPVVWRDLKAKPAAVSVTKFAAMFWDFYPPSESSCSNSRSMMSVLNFVGFFVGFRFFSIFGLEMVRKLHSGRK